MQYTEIAEEFSGFAPRLFYSVPSLQQDFTDDPTRGEFDPERFLAQGRSDCFRTTGLKPGVFHPKTIVITDPTLYRNGKVVSYLLALQNRGFTIYQYGANGIELFPSTDGGFAPCYSSNPSHVVAKLIAIDSKLCADQVLTLSYFGTRALISKSTISDIEDYDRFEPDMRQAIADSYKNEPVSLQTQIVADTDTEKVVLLSRFFTIGSLDMVYDSFAINYLLTANVGLSKLEQLTLFDLIPGGSTSDVMQLLNQCSGLRQLILRPSRLTSGQFIALSKSRGLASLEVLEISDTRLDDVDPKILVAFLANFANLRDFGLSNCSITANHLVAFTKSSCLATVEVLDLSYNDVDKVDSKTIVAFFSSLSKLRHFILYGSCITSDQFIAISNSACLSSLEVLELRDDLRKIDHKTLVAFFSRLPKLRRLELRGSNITADQFIAISNSACLSSLEVLNVERNCLKAVSAGTLVAFFSNLKKLRQLNIKKCYLTEEHLVALSSSPCLDLIEVLNLSGNDLSAVCIEVLVAFFSRLSKLREINLEYCYLTPKQFVALSQLPNLRLVGKIGLKGNNLHQVEPDVLADIFSKFLRLSELSCNLSMSELEAQKSVPNMALIARAKRGFGLDFADSRRTSTFTHKDQCERVCTDTDTVENQGKKITVTRCFKNVDPSRYRQRVFTTGDGDTFELNYVPISGEIVTTQFPEVSEKKLAEKNTELGEITLPPGERVWLPSLHPGEELVALSLSPGTKYDLYYNNKYNLYSIRVHGSFPTPCQYVLRVTPQEPFEFESVYYDRKKMLTKSFDEFLNYLHEYNEKYGNSKLVKLLAKYFNTEFSSGGLENISESDSVDKQMEAIIMQRKGSCRHRTMAFMYLVHQLNIRYGIKIDAYGVANDCHMFPCVKIDYHWRHINLGGYPVELVERPAINSEVHTRLRYDTYAGRFACWKYSKLTQEEVQRMVESLADSAQHQEKRLLLVDTEEQAQQLYWYLLRQLHKKEAACYGIDEPEKMVVCQSLCIANGKYDIVSGELAIFLNNMNTQSRSLVIDWNKFNSQQICAAQSCMDDPAPAIGATALPFGTHIIGIMTKARFEKADDSFISRVGRAGVAEVDCDMLFRDVAPAPASVLGGNNIELTINLYGEYSEPMLIGAAQLTADGWEYRLGSLAKCCDKKIRHLVIKNPPADSKFEKLLQQIRSEQALWYNGAKHQLPEGFRITCTEEQYRFCDVQVTDISPSEVSSEYIVINNANYQSLFSSLQFKDQQCFTLPGWLEQEGALKVVITEELTRGQWARMLDYAQEKGCCLELFAYSEVVVPSECNRKVKDSTTDVSQNPPTMVITANPIAHASKLSKQPGCIYIPITEHTVYTDLISRINIDLQHKTIDSIYCYLLEELKNGKDIIFFGAMSPTLFSQLETLFLPEPYLWINHEKHSFPNSKVRLITDKDTFAHRAADCARDTSEHTVEVKHPITVFTSKTNADMVNKNRIASMLNALKENPMVFIEGKTAVGKSYFVKYVLPNESSSSRITVYDGFERFKDWAKQKPSDSSVSILFIDEANMQDARQLSSLLGIYGSPRGVTIDGELYPLSEQHKIVLAGNPKEYQHRHLPDCFAKYPVPTIQFSELPEVYLRDKVLEEVWRNAPENNLLHNNKHEINELFISCYNIAKQISPHITPRNLQMMLLHLLCMPSLSEYTPQIFAAGPKYCEKAAYAAYLEIIGSLTAEEINKFNVVVTNDEKLMLNTGYTAEYQVLNMIKREMSPEFIAVECYTESMLQLKKLMDIRKLKDKNPCLSKFGYQAITIEGEPGVGKTEMVKNMLRVMGFDHCCDDSSIGEEGNGYYQLNPNNLAELDRIVNVCVCKGLILLVDEGNLVMPLLEAKLNPLLQGEKGHLKAIKPGFMVICTQNPATYSGRLAESDSGRARHITTTIEPSARDLEVILTTKHKLTTEATERHIKDYLATRDYAHARGLTSPTPRDLYKAHAPSPGLNKGAAEVLLSP